eukprot:Selendium_serpulae@DN1030_c0_g1_i1.p1
MVYKARLLPSRNSRNRLLTEDHFRGSRILCRVTENFKPLSKTRSPLSKTRSPLENEIGKGDRLSDERLGLGAHYTSRKPEPPTRTDRQHHSIPDSELGNDRPSSTTDRSFVVRHRQTKLFSCSSKSPINRSIDQCATRSPLGAGTTPVPARPLADDPLFRQTQNLAEH